ncbi:hypothetical protein [Ectopseudomonas khazarica]|uniref:hypothetical protein n=1 Tax=Ectopseudomonas khazarica TaxID=2502979 RepID=UPI002FE0B779
MSILYGLLGLVVHFVEGKTSPVELWVLANNVLKFCAWFMFGYGTLQALGRRFEFETIEERASEADRAYGISKLHAQTQDEVSHLESNHNSDYKRGIEALDTIERDEGTTFKLYVIGIVLFFICSLGDIVLPAFQN